MMEIGLFIDGKIVSVEIGFSFEAFELCDSFGSFDMDVDAGCNLGVLCESKLLELDSIGRDTMLICVVVGVFLLASGVSFSFGFNKIRGLSGAHLSSLSLFFAKIMGRFGSYTQKNTQINIRNLRKSVEFQWNLPYFDWIFGCVYFPTSLCTHIYIIDIVSMHCQTWQSVNVICTVCVYRL